MNRRTFLGSARLRVNNRGERGTRMPAASLAAPGLEPYGGVWDRTAALHLLRRTVIAPTHAEVDEAVAMGLDALVEKLLNDTTPLPGASPFVGECMNEGLIAWDSSRVDLSDSFFDELRRWWYTLMINGGLSLRERMTLFWHNHFPSDLHLAWDARHLYIQNQLFRANALGNFKDLVRQVSIDRGMLLFLSGKYNKAQWPNENYARELMELFTVGIADNNGNPNYTQADIVEAARALTGWDWPGYGILGDVASNILSQHDIKDKHPFGATITGNADGLPELNQLLDLIFAKEDAARYVIRKIYRFFVYTDVTLTPVKPVDPAIEEAIVAPLAADFRAANWDIRVVLRRLLKSAHFFDAGFMGAVIKSPVDLLVGTLRATAAGAITGNMAEYGTQIAQDRAKRLGQDLFAPPGVQGWQFHHAWISTTTLPLRRKNTDELVEETAVNYIDRATLVFNGPVYRSGTWKMDVLAFAKQFASFNDPAALVSDICEHLLAFPADDELRARLKNVLVASADYEWSDAPADIQDSRLRAMLRTLMRTSNYQLM
ncbi:MAG: DUF1800 domain-containing protein [Bacteroidetes bacterium]|nr:DUF1800 domain-containing protein [Bacteroidota bacterium]